MHKLSEGNVYTENLFPARSWKILQVRKILQDSRKLRKSCKILLSCKKLARSCKKKIFCQLGFFRKVLVELSYLKFFNSFSRIFRFIYWNRITGIGLIESLKISRKPAKAVKNGAQNSGSFQTNYTQKGEEKDHDCFEI